MRLALALSLSLASCGCAATDGLEPAGAALAHELDAGGDASAAPDAAPTAPPMPAPAPLPQCFNRCVRGVVTRRDGAPAARLPVLLEDRRTLQIRSYITSDAGEYRFLSVSAEAEYEVSARAADGSSARASVSPFDDRTEIVVDLALR